MALVDAIVYWVVKYVVPTSEDNFRFDTNVMSNTHMTKIMRNMLSILAENSNLLPDYLRTFIQKTWELRYDMSVIVSLAEVTFREMVAGVRCIVRIISKFALSAEKDLFASLLGLFSYIILHSLAQK